MGGVAGLQNGATWQLTFQQKHCFVPQKLFRRGRNWQREVVEVCCDFCGQQFHFDAVEVARMFTPERDQPAAPPTLQ